MVNPEISKYMSELSKKRKKPYYGFKDPKVQKKIQESKKRNAQEKIRQSSDGPS